MEVLPLREGHPVKLPRLRRYCVTVVPGGVPLRTFFTLSGAVAFAVNHWRCAHLFVWDRFSGRWSKLHRIWLPKDEPE